MKTTFTTTEMNELLSIAQAEIKELKADNSILQRENKRMHQERDGLYETIGLMNENIDSIVYFGLNYSYNFIAECWADDPVLANHLSDKFAICTEGLRESRQLSYGVFTRFITMLDQANREKLYQYIIENYSHKTGFKVRHTEEA